MTSDPRTVLIVRHGEKPGDAGHEAPEDGVDLSARGKQRAAGLAYALPEAFGTPDVVIAAASTAHSHRPVQTVTPLADALHQQIHDKYADTDYAALAHHLRTHDKYAGKLIVVCWHHGRIPALAEALGADAPVKEWPDAVFDRVWRIDFPAHETGTAEKLPVTNLPQRLLFGDAGS